MFQTFFFGHTGKENVFYDILERINAFLGYKNKKFKKVENLTFFQRGFPMVLAKIAIFQTFFFGHTGKENVFYDILY